MSGKDRGHPRRSYRPGVEALEALRLLSGVAELPMGPAIGPADFSPATGAAPAPIPGDAWDAALVDSRLGDWLGPDLVEAPAAPADVASGLTQLDRYLGRAWYRAGLPPQQHDDCTQAVYASLLGAYGRDRFDRLLAEVGQFGIRDVLSRETADGPDFFRAIDTVKKRAQRERSHQPLDAAAYNRPDDSPRGDWRGTLREAIDSSLSPREAALIHATLRGETPTEIAQHWGVAPKTVSNEKTRALQKLREALVADLID